MTIWDDRPVAPLLVPGSTVWLLGYVPAKSGPFCALMPSRLARNGRDWHHLLELCGLVEARVIDLDGVYNPCRPNDRLLLGMKGSISEFELGVLRARMLDAARLKAGRASCGYAFPSATSGTVTSGLVSIPTDVCKR